MKPRDKVSTREYLASIVEVTQQLLEMSPDGEDSLAILAALAVADGELYLILDALTD